MPVYLGTSGWQYRSWRGTFYPAELRQAAWLEHYAERFSLVEVNNAFYRLPERETFENWCRRTPEDFLVAVKASRYITHVRRLRQPAEPVARLVERASGLGSKRGPILLQLPPNLPADLEALASALACFPPGWRLAVEFRHDSWFTDATRRLLEDRRTALCLADSPHRSTPTWRTTDWGYLRFHEGRATPAPCYDQAALATWARLLAEKWGGADDVHVLFNNDARACAVRDATVFAAVARAAGLEPTRVPAATEVDLG